MTAGPLADYPRTVVLRDGVHVVLRPMVPADRSAVDALRARADEEREFGLDGAEAVVLAWDGERLAAASLLRRKHATGRIALAIHPDYQGRRLGTWMLLDLVHLASALGLARLEAHVRADDGPYLAALHRLDFARARARDGGSLPLWVKTLHAGWTDF